MSNKKRIRKYTKKLSARKIKFKIFSEHILDYYFKYPDTIIDFSKQIEKAGKNAELAAKRFLSLSQNISDLSLEYRKREYYNYPCLLDEPYLGRKILNDPKLINKEYRLPQRFFSDHDISFKIIDNIKVYTAYLIESRFRYELDFIIEDDVTKIIEERRIMLPRFIY